MARESDIESAPDPGAVRQTGEQQVSGRARRNGIGVEKPEYVASCHSCALVHLDGASMLKYDNTIHQWLCQLYGAVVATAITKDDLVASGSQRLE